MKLMQKCFLLIVISSLMLPCAFALPRGNSAWVYGIKDSWVEQIQGFNAGVKKSHQFKYLFVDVGSATVKDNGRQLVIAYDKRRTRFYKKKLKDVKILASISFWVKGTGFYRWDKATYQSEADKIARLVISDPNVCGVFLDLETYKKKLLPFYVELRKKLSAHNEILSVIVSPGDETISWFNALGANSIVVLYGYDLHKNADSSIPVSPAVYARRLKYAVKHFVDISSAAKRFFMIGVPAIATTYEWQKKTVETGEVLKNPFTQADYFKASMNVNDEISSKYYLGVSVWAFISSKRGQIYYPLKLSSAEWNVLKD